MEQIECLSRLDIFRKTDDHFLRSCGSIVNLPELPADGYISYTIYLHNTQRTPVCWQQARAEIDGRNACSWGSGRIDAFARIRLRVSPERMLQQLQPGKHQVVWYLDDRAIHSADFRITDDMDWEAFFPSPTPEQIRLHNLSATHRSQYLTYWMFIPENTRFTEFSVEFRTGHLPRGTYYSLANWDIDCSHLEKKGYRLDSKKQTVMGYAGFQRIADGRTVRIMSIWDLGCTDPSGHKTELRAKLLYPQDPIDGNRFWGEGTGMRATAPYHWETDRWYRMHLRCMPTDRDTTLLEQWCCEVVSGEMQLLTRYELPVPNGAFKGNMAAFLENYLPAHSGDVRSLEVKNPCYREEATGRWKSPEQACLGPHTGLPEYEGSYRFAMAGSRALMATSGVGGDWFHNGQGKKADYYSY